MLKMNLTNATLLLITILTLGLAVNGQTMDVEAVTPDGKIVILKSDGTWAKKEVTKGKVLGVTAAAYASISEGMSYAETVEIIGSPGEVTADATSSGVRTFSVEWRPKAASSTTLMSLVFQNDKLLSKMQFGLK